MAQSKQFAAALGDDGMKKLDQLEAASVESYEHQLFSLNPKMSYVSEDTIKADPDFWKPKSAATAAKPTPAAKPAQ